MDKIEWNFRFYKKNLKILIFSTSLGPVPFFASFWILRQLWSKILGNWQKLCSWFFFYLKVLNEIFHFRGPTPLYDNLFRSYGLLKICSKSGSRGRKSAPLRSKFSKIFFFFSFSCYFDGFVPLYRFLAQLDGFWLF